MEVGDILKSSHTAFKVLYFNNDQQALLTTDNIMSAIFLCDFGAGKNVKLFLFNKMDFKW